MSEAVAMIGIPTEIDLKEIFFFFQKSESALNMSHCKVLSQQHKNKHNIEYCVVCSFETHQDAKQFVADLNGKVLNAQISSTATAQLFYLMDDEQSTAEQIENDSNCAFCFDSINTNSIDSNADKKKQKWLSSNKTVCFVLCGHFFHVCCLMRCEQNSCPICRHYLFPEDLSVCSDCGLCTKDLWVCLTCGHVGCGRNSNRCALKHYKATSHIWAKCLMSSHVWDYADDDYVYRILQMAENGKMVALSVQNHNDGIDGSAKQLPLELDILSSVKQEQFIYEYNFVINDRLRRLQKFHALKKEQMLKAKTQQIHKMDEKIKKLRHQIANKRKQIEKCQIPKNVKIESVQTLREQLKNEKNKNEKLKKMIHRALNEQKNFNQKKREFEQKLKRSLLTIERTLDLELNDLSNECRDYRAHIDTKRKMQKCASVSELNNAEIGFKQGKTKNNKKRKKGHSNKNNHKKSKKHRK